MSYNVTANATITLGRGGLRHHGIQDKEIFKKELKNKYSFPSERGRMPLVSALLQFTLPNCGPADNLMVLNARINPENFSSYCTYNACNTPVLKHFSAKLNKCRTMKPGRLTGVTRGIICVP